MTRGSLWKISARTTPEAEDAVSEALAHLCDTPANTHTDFRTGRATVSVFAESRPHAFAEIQRAWKRTVVRLQSFGLRTGPARLRLERIRRQNWAESWKRHFKPLAIGDALLLKPSWIKRKAKPGQAVVVLDPGLSFGTGQHATTSFCLKELVRHRLPSECGSSRPAALRHAEAGRNVLKAAASSRAAARERARSLLDIGTGSGILAIAAAKLGYAPVHAFDFDPESVRVARANAKVNRVDRKLRITPGDLTKLPAKPARCYDVVCANLISTLLIAERRRLVARVKRGGVLVVAGILKTEFHQVQSTFEALGLRLIASKREKEWASGTFQIPTT